MNLNANGKTYRFDAIPLHYAEGTYSNVFACKNNKTLDETVAHRRYAALADKSRRTYRTELATPVGSFLMQLKAAGDEFYRRFLNSYGDLSYSRFWLEDDPSIKERGLYLYADGNRLLYIGRCRDSFRKRINQGYGMIHPKNCFIDGQATNCHINSLITNQGHNIQFELCAFDDIQSIISAECHLIGQYQPPWNIQGR